eukprot:4557065-Amphidinium_carterae.2
MGMCVEVEAELHLDQEAVDGSEAPLEYEEYPDGRSCGLVARKCTARGMPQHHGKSIARVIRKGNTEAGEILAGADCSGMSITEQSASVPFSGDSSGNSCAVLDGDETSSQSTWGMPLDQEPTPKVYLACLQHM